jgi:hypothetical protein
MHAALFDVSPVSKHDLQLALFAVSDVSPEPKRLAVSLVITTRRHQLRGFIRDCLTWLSTIVYPAQGAVQINPTSKGGER